MTRKHFKVLADAMKGNRPVLGDGADARAQWVSDCMALADACQKANGNFDYDRFFAACGIAD
jgi:hypothetical protein